MSLDPTASQPSATAEPKRGSRWLREPLLHFLVIGAVLFMLYRVLNGPGQEAPRRIVVSASRVDALAENFARTWMRPPSAGELKGLVDDYVAEEVYYREAIAMGLDRDDTVIRRRLRQKMEFVTDDLASATPATDADLQGYLDAHKDKFALPGRVTFRQVFLSADKRGDSVERDAAQMLERLKSGPPAMPTDELGDPTMLPPSMESASQADIDNTFGAEIAAAVMAAPVGQWIGPVASGYGVHLIRVDLAEAGSLPTLAEARPAVEREWQSEQRRKARDEFLRQLESKYDVSIEGPLGEALHEAGGASPARTTP